MTADRDECAEVQVALASGDRRRALDQMLAMSLTVGDRERKEAILREQLTYGTDDQVRRLAATCLGHVARLHGALTPQSITLLAELRDDPVVAGTVGDALDDIEMFVRTT